MGVGPVRCYERGRTPTDEEKRGPALLPAFVRRGELSQAELSR